MKGWERAIKTLSVRRHQPHNTNQRMKEEKVENIGRQKWSEQPGE